MRNADKKQNKPRKRGLDNYILKYYQGIKNGSIVVGEWVKLVYEKIVEGLETKAYVFDQKKANDAIEWFEKHTSIAKGRLRLETFLLNFGKKRF